MADIFSASFGQKNLHMAEFGNGWAENYSGPVTAASGDKFYFGVIPAGVEVDYVRLVNEATAVSVTLSLGYEPIDGSPAANTTAFFTTQAVATASSAFSSAAPIRFEKPVRLVGTVGGAAITGGKIFTVSVKGKDVGVK